LTRKLQGSWPESALDSMFVAFPIGKPVSTFPGNALNLTESKSRKRGYRESFIDGDSTRTIGG
jgi:hypothetical protein